MQVTFRDTVWPTRSPWRGRPSPTRLAGIPVQFMAVLMDYEVVPSSRIQCPDFGVLRMAAEHQQTRISAIGLATELSELRDALAKAGASKVKKGAEASGGPPGVAVLPGVDHIGAAMGHRDHGSTPVPGGRGKTRGGSSGVPVKGRQCQSSQELAHAALNGKVAEHAVELQRQASKHDCANRDIIAARV